MKTPPLLQPVTEAEIRERAYQLWLERGCPENRDHEIWFAAQALLHSERRAAPPRRARTGESPHDHRPAVARSGAPQRLRAHHRLSTKRPKA